MNDEQTITLKEAWLACGGNPDMVDVPGAFTKDDVLTIMRLNAEIADEAYEAEEKRK